MNPNPNEPLREGQFPVMNGWWDLVGTFPHALNVQRQSSIPTTQRGGREDLNDDNTASQRNEQDLFAFFAQTVKRSNTYVNSQQHAMSSQPLLQPMIRMNAREVFNQQIINDAILSYRDLKSTQSSASLTPQLLIPPHERTPSSCDDFDCRHLLLNHANSRFSNQSLSISPFDLGSSNCNGNDFSNHTLRNHKKTDDACKNDKDSSQNQDFMIAPCPASRMPIEHNYKTAYFVIKNNIRHGDELICSYELCRNSGIKFKYCSHCKIPVSKRNFAKKHTHEDSKEATIRHVEVKSVCGGPEFGKMSKTAAVVGDEKRLLCVGKRKYEELCDPKESCDEELATKKCSSLKEHSYVIG